MGEQSILANISLCYNKLSEVQKRIASFYLSNPQKIAQMTLKNIAGELSISETAVIRFINKIGYKSFKLFQIAVLKDSSITENIGAKKSLRIEDGYSEINPSDDVRAVKKKVIISAVNAIGSLDNFVSDSAIERTAKLFLRAKHILFYGSGGSSCIAKDAHHKFMRLGLPTIYEENSHFAIIRAAHLNKDDVIVLISHTGESREVLESAKNAKRREVTVVGITSYSQSSLIKAADITLHSAVGTVPYYTDAMVSRLLQLLIFDMIFVRCTLLLGSQGKTAVEISRLAISSAKR